MFSGKGADLLSYWYVYLWTEEMAQQLKAYTSLIQVLVQVPKSDRIQLPVTPVSALCKQLHAYTLHRHRYTHTHTHTKL